MRRNSQPANAKEHPRLGIWQAMAKAMTGATVDFSVFDEDDILWLAADQGVCQILDSRAQYGTVRGLKETTRAALAAKSRDQVALDMLQSRDTRRLLALLAEHDIPTLLLKGTPLAYVCYEESFQRPRTDTDLYIQDDHAATVLDLLASQGYSIHREQKRTLASKQFVASIASFQNISSHFDIHWRLSNRVLFRSCLPFKECLERRQAIPKLGPSAFTLSAIDLLMHGCIHRIAHGRNTERNRLIWLYDIHLLWAASDEEQRAAFIEKALTKKIGAVCADALAVCDDLFGTLTRNPDASGSGLSRYNKESTSSNSRLKPLPQSTHSSTLESLLKNRSQEPTARLVNSGKLRWAWEDMMALEGIGNKARYATELLFH